MRQPFFPLVLALILGIIFTYYFQINILFTIVLLGLLISVFIYLIFFEKDIKFILFLLLFTLGIFLTLSNKTVLSEYLNRNADYVGIVDRVLTTNTANGKYIIKVEKANNIIIPKEKVILNVISKKDLVLGNRVSFNGVAKLPMKNTNPKLYNYRLNLLSEKIYGTITIKDYQIKTLQNEKSFSYNIKAKFTEDVEKLFNTYLNRENSQLITSIILGESSYLDEDSLTLYRELGIAHILAVSGLHIGIISGFLIFLFSRLGLKRKLNIIISLSIIWTYGFLIGYPPSILRASIMFSILFYSQIIHEPYDSINILSIACFLLLVINPYYLFHIGFQLSFMATFSIVYFTPYIKAAFYPYNTKLTNTIAALLAVNLGILPFQAYYFNRIGIFSILANMILIPIFSIALIIGFIMLLILYSLRSLNIIIGPILDFILSIQYKIMQFIPHMVMKVYSPEFIHILIYFVILAIVLRIIYIDKFGKSIIKVIYMYLIVLIIVNSLFVFGDKSMEVHFIDVGQGDSILIRTRNGDYLMDTGGSLMENSFDISKNITLPYLEKLGINRLKAIFITHFHADHCQGLPLLLESLKVDNIVASYIPKANNYPIIVVEKGDNITLDKKTNLKIIWPDKTVSSNENNMSMVGLLTYNNSQVLLTGDIEREVEPLVSEYLNTKIDILKVPHHGSSTSSSEKFLEVLRPDISVISVGRKNLHNHPSPEVLSRYVDFDSNVYRTDENGLIKIHFTGDKYTITSFIKEDKINLLEFLTKNVMIICYILLYSSITYKWINVYIMNFKEMRTIEL